MNEASAVPSTTEALMKLSTFRMPSGIASSYWQNDWPAETPIALRMQKAALREHSQSGSTQKRTIRIGRLHRRRYWKQPLWRKLKSK
jgi:hypothetical protein